MPAVDPALPLDTLPQLLLDVAAVEHNIAVKQAWARDHHMVLAPHIKTTMTEQIVRRQLPGAWGATVATVAQAAKAIEWGAPRVLLANEVVFGPHLRQLRRWLDADAGLEIYCLADSATGVQRLAAAFDGAARPLQMLVDVGTGGGRSGIRSASAALPLAKRITASPGLRLAGVSAYEGVAPNLRTAGNLARVDTHCLLARDVFELLRPQVQAGRPVFSLGGSAFQDRAAAVLPAGAVNVLRSGCYVVHDHGTYAGVSPVPGLVAAALVRTLVVSAPEPGLAVLNAGKRELAYDAGLPVLVAAYRDGTALPASAARWRSCSTTTRSLPPPRDWPSGTSSTWAFPTPARCSTGGARWWRCAAARRKSGARPSDRPRRRPGLSRRWTGGRRVRCPAAAARDRRR